MEFPYTETPGLTIEGIHSPRWTDREKIRIDCVLVTKEHGEIPFTSCPWDTHENLPHCPLIFEHLAQGHAGPVGEWDRPLPSVEDLQADLDKLMPDIVLGLATPEELELARLLRKQIKVMSE